MTNGYYSKYATLAVVGSVLLHAEVVPVAAAQITADRSLVPPAIRDAFLQEFSGELALQHVQLLAANRMRPISEYADTFFETSYLREMAERYGLSDVRVDYLPRRRYLGARGGRVVDGGAVQEELRGR